MDRCEGQFESGVGDLGCWVEQVELGDKVERLVDKVGKWSGR